MIRNKALQDIGPSAIWHCNNFERDDRREPGPYDVQIDILFCGVCHSDLHAARNEWKNTIYPSVPGHEIAAG